MVLEKRPLELNNRRKLLFYILIRKFDFDESYIRQNRRSLQEVFYKQIGKSLNLRAEVEYDNNGYKRLASFAVENQKDDECNKEWQVCIYDNNYKNTIANHIIRKKGRKLNYLPNWFFERVPDKKNSRREVFVPYEENDVEENQLFDKKLLFEDLLIERRRHLCDIRIERMNTLTIRELLRESKKDSRDEEKESWSNIEKLVMTLERESDEVNRCFS